MSIAKEGSGVICRGRKTSNRRKTRVTGEKPRKKIEIDKSEPTNGAQDSNQGLRSGRRD